MRSRASFNSIPRLAYDTRMRSTVGACSSRLAPVRDKGQGTWDKGAQLLVVKLWVLRTRRPSLHYGHLGLPCSSRLMLQVVRRTFVMCAGCIRTVQMMMPLCMQSSRMDAGSKAPPHPPNAAARASYVTSSCVGPMPPLVNTKPAGSMHAVILT